MESRIGCMLLLGWDPWAVRGVGGCPSEFGVDITFTTFNINSNIMIMSTTSMSRILLISEDESMLYLFIYICLFLYLYMCIYSYNLSIMCNSSVYLDSPISISKSGIYIYYLCLFIVDRLVYMYIFGLLYLFLHSCRFLYLYMCIHLCDLYIMRNLSTYLDSPMSISKYGIYMYYLGLFIIDRLVYMYIFGFDHVILDRLVHMYIFLFRTFWLKFCYARILTL